MTGSEFKSRIKALGYSLQGFADLTGVHRHTIGAQCKAEEIDKLWVYVLAGVVSTNNASQIAELSQKIGPSVRPRKLAVTAATSTATRGSAAKGTPPVVLPGCEKEGIYS